MIEPDYKFIFEKELYYSLDACIALRKELSDLLGKGNYGLDWTWITGAAFQHRRALLCVKLQDNEQLAILKLRYGNLERKV